MPRTTPTENGVAKLTSQNVNAILMYVVTFGVGLVATQTFLTAGRVSKIEGAQVTRTELENKLGAARGELNESLKGVQVRQDKASDKQDKISDALAEIRVEIARLHEKKDVTQPRH